MSILDAARLENLRRDVGDDGVREIAAVLFREGPKRVEEMRAALSAKDRATLERAAHSLKSNARLFGANELGDRCRELEEASRERIPPDAGKRIDEVAKLYAKADKAIRQTVADL